jgi:hypothetical protein
MTSALPKASAGGALAVRCVGMTDTKRPTRALIAALLLGSTITALAAHGAGSAAAAGASAPAVRLASAAAPSGEDLPIGDRPGWRQIFTDDFTTDVPLGSFPAAVSTKWGAYPSPWTDTTGYGTYSPSTVVSVSGGILNDHIHTENGVSMVAALTPKLPKPMLYGRYAVRYRFDSLPGYKVAWMLWPDSNDNETDGEIDFPEMNLDTTTVWAYDHRTDSTGSGDQAWANAPITPGTWHTSVIEWSPNLVVFQYDGVEIGRNSVRTPVTPMHWVLQTETALTLGHAPDPSVAGNVQIDWAAAWAYDASTADTTAPSVAVLSPTDGASVAGTQTLSVDATDDQAVVGVQFKVDGGNVGSELTSPPYTTQWNTMLVANGAHIVTAVARDFAGNVTTAPVTVDVANIQDVTPPTVGTVVPQVSGTIFPVGANIYAQFSEAVDGVSATSFTLRNTATGALVPAAVSYNLTTSQSQAALNPDSALTNDTKYTVTLTSAITDRSGNPLTPFSWSFVTGPAPYVLSTAPSAGATNVSRTADITAAISEDVTKVGSTTAMLVTSSGAQVAASASFSSTTDLITINPTATLAANTTYTVKLTTGIKDLIGNPLRSLTWSFTTGA